MHIVTGSLFMMLSTTILSMTDSYRKKVFFKYEKRIRMQSPPEKVRDFVIIDMY